MGEPASPAGTPVVELRLFKLHPGVLDEFHRISRDGTIPLMRDCGINVLAFGPSLYEDNAYYLVRHFASEAERVDLGQSLYKRPEWDAEYDEPVSGMIESYHTIVMPANAAVVAALDV